jgi:ketosteroid isomerase-like protein
MRALFGLFCLLPAMSVAPSRTLAQTPPTAAATNQQRADEATIRRILLEPGRNRHTSTDLDWENAFGVRRRGLEETKEFLKRRVTPTMTQAHDTTLEIRLNFVTPDVVVADQYWRLWGLTLEDGSPVPDRQGRDTYVFRREHGSWILALARIADLRRRLEDAPQ